MQKNKNAKPAKNRSKKPLVIVVVTIVVLAGLGAWYAYDHRNTSATLPPNVAKSSSPADNSLNNQRKSSSKPATTLNNGSTSTSNPPTSSTPITVDITRASVFGNSLQVGSLVDGTSAGTCTLNVSQTGEQTIVKTESVALQNNAYVCPAFNVPLSQFPNQNGWNVSVTVASSGQSATGNWVDNPVNLSGNQ